MLTVSSVHFGRGFDNAMWHSEKHQMVYGDGGTLLGNFAGCLDVVGHEMTHGITEHTTPLVYAGQPGALNEHISDVFGVMIKQWAEHRRTADADADWLLGEGCLLPGVTGVALRSIKSPGTAYNDPRLGRDPQVSHMRDYAPLAATDDGDFGGAHVYSGIPNRAFYLAAVRLGGCSWERAGRVWWRTMTGGHIAEDCSFQHFAEATVQVTGAELGPAEAEIVRGAWLEVGIVVK